MPGVNELDGGRVAGASKYPPGPRNVPKQPAAVIKIQPQAEPSGVDDGHDGFHLAGHLVLRHSL